MRDKSLLYFLVGVISSLIPSKFREDILGDLFEVYYVNLAKGMRKSVAALCLFARLGQTVFYFQTRPLELAKFGLLIVTSIMAICLIKVIVWLSWLSDLNHLPAEFWLNWQKGYVFLVFLEPEFWNHAINKDIEFTIDIWLNNTALIYALISVSIILLSFRHYSVRTTCFFALLSFVFPSLFLMVFFQLNNVPINLSGPYAAVVWLSNLYLVGPYCLLGLSLIAKGKTSTKVEFD